MGDRYASYSGLLLPPPASVDQSEQAIEIAQAAIAQPDEYIHQLNQNSLRWRGK